MRNPLFLAGILLLSGSAFAAEFDHETDWYSFLDGMESSITLERRIVEKQIDRLRAGQPTDPSALHKKLTADEASFVDSHQGLYGVICTEKHLAPRCGSWGSLRAHEDLNSIQEKMSLADLQNRMKYLNDKEADVKTARTRQQISGGLRGLQLVWDSPPHVSPAGKTFMRLSFIFPQATPLEARHDQPAHHSKRLTSEDVRVSTWAWPAEGARGPQ